MPSPMRPIDVEKMLMQVEKAQEGAPVSVDFKKGDMVEAKVLDVDVEKERVSLGIKQCQPNPWAEFSTSFNRGDKVTGQIKSITDFGIFIGLDGGIDGLVHLSDIAWEVPGEEAVRNYRKGQEIEVDVVDMAFGGRGLTRVDGITSSVGAMTTNASALTSVFAATVGSPLIKVAAFSYGVRVALSGLRKGPS